MFSAGGGWGEESGLSRRERWQEVDPETSGVLGSTALAQGGQGGPCMDPKEYCTPGEKSGGPARVQ